jgi:hypothetical protein
MATYSYLADSGVYRLSTREATRRRVGYNCTRSPVLERESLRLESSRRRQILDHQASEPQ